MARNTDLAGEKMRGRFAAGAPGQGGKMGWEFLVARFLSALAQFFTAPARILALAFALSPVAWADPAGAGIMEECPKYAQNPAFRPTLEYYSYRLRKPVAEHGCDAILAYHAFDSEHGVTLALAEEDDALMQRLIGVLGRIPGFAEMLHENARLAQALDLRLGNRETREEFWQILERINGDCVQAALGRHPEIAALALLLPNVSPKYLKKNFSRQELALLPVLINQAGLDSSIAQVEGMEALLPFIASNPADSLAIYRKVLEAWGCASFRRFSQESPQAVFAAVPPLSQSSLEGLNPLNSSPARFHEMQEEYIRLCRDLYNTIGNEQGAAWGAEFCMAFADILPLALLGPDSAGAGRIRQLLADLGRSDFFFRVLKPSACFEETNVALLGKLLSLTATAVQPLSNRIHFAGNSADNSLYEQPLRFFQGRNGKAARGGH